MPMIFTQHHLFCSHFAVVYNGSTVSIETAQMVFDPNQTFDPQLVYVQHCSLYTY